MLEERVQLTDGTVHLTRTGGAGAPVLMLHPLPGDGRFYRPLFAALEAQGHDHALMAMDLPGNGRSSKERGALDFASQSRAVIELLDRLSVERVHLLGTSYGGILSIYLAAHHPQRVRSLILSGMNAYRDFRMPLGARIMSSKLGRALVPLAKRGALLRGYTEQFHDPEAIDPVHLDDLWNSAAEPGGLWCLWKQAHNIDFALIEPELPRIDAPTLLLWGAQDRASPLNWPERMVRDFPRARLAVLEACGHYPPMEQPAAFAAQALSFLAEARSQSPAPDGLD